MLNKKDEVSIFEHESVNTYLSSVFQHRKALRPTFSLRSWALKLGLKVTDSGNLSRILTGQRDVSKQLADRIAQDLSLDHRERAYFELLVVGRTKISRESLDKIRTCLKECAEASTP